MTRRTINQIQDDLVLEFAHLNGDLELVLMHIANFGFLLPAMPEAYRTEQNLIKGCHSKVWLSASDETQGFHFYADSDTIISKGLVSLLVHIFNGQSADEILEAELYFIRESRLERFIGTKRSNGFAAMLEQVRRLVPGAGDRCFTSPPKPLSFFHTR